MHDVSINPIWLLAIAAIFFVAGFLIRSSQIKKSRKKVLSLENEMLKNHAEILKLQQDLVNLQEQCRSTQTPVVSIKDASFDEANDIKDPLHRKRIR